MNESGASDDDPEVAARTQEETTLRVAGTGSHLEHRANERSASDTLRPAAARIWADLPHAVQHPAHPARRRQAAAHPGDRQPHHYHCAWDYRPDCPAGAGRLRPPAALREGSPGHLCGADGPRNEDPG